MARPDPDSLEHGELSRALARLALEYGIASHTLANGTADVSAVDPETLAWWRAALAVHDRRVAALPRERPRQRDAARPAPRRVRAKESPERAADEKPAWQRGKRDP